MKKEFYLIKWINSKSSIKYEIMSHISGTNSYAWTTGFGVPDIRFPPFSKKSVEDDMKCGVYDVIKLN